MPVLHLGKLFIHVGMKEPMIVPTVGAMVGECRMIAICVEVGQHEYEVHERSHSCGGSKIGI